MNRILFLSLLFIFPVFACEIKQFKLAIDIGHTPKYGGATSATGVKEYRFNKRLAIELFKQIQLEGFKKAYIINVKNGEISLLQRVKIANSNNTNLFISLHHDSVQTQYLSHYYKDGKKMHYSDIYAGYSIFYSKYNPKMNNSKKYALILGEKLLQQSLTPTLHHAEKIKGENRELIDKIKGIYQFEDLIVLKKTTMPSVLFESGIIVNREEEDKLNMKEYRRKIINAIIQSVKKYCHIQ